MASAFQRAQDGFNRTRIDHKKCLQSRQISALCRSGEDIGFVDFQAMGRVILSMLKAFESRTNETNQIAEYRLYFRTFRPQSRIAFESHLEKNLTLKRHKIETCGFLHRFAREKVLSLGGQFFNFKRIGARDHVQFFKI